MNARVIADKIPAGATLSSGSRSASLRWTPTKPGRYDFEIRVADSGWPSESVTKRFQIVVQDPRPVAPRPPKPVFDITAHTVLTAILRGGDGRKTVWLHERTTDIMHKRFQGDEFKVGTATVVVKEIRSDDATLEVNGKLRDIARGERLNGGKAPRVAYSGPTLPRTNRRPDRTRNGNSGETQKTERKKTELTPELQAKYAKVKPGYLTYYIGLFDQSDTNGNSRLDKDEWAGMRTNPQPADVNDDDEVSLHEFILWRAASQK
ncbi:MAG: hypothetical protein IH991_22440 [Planctomycetes bacterium]|nr:hypothetical protein [Planctomycetota bacterium]